MIDFLLNFLGIRSWFINFTPCKKRKLNIVTKTTNRNIKSLNILKLLDEETPSPKLEIYTLRKYKKPTKTHKVKLCIYTLYSFMIFLLLMIQPIYTLYKFYLDVSNIKYLSSFFIHICIPIIYTWGKYYFTTDHLELYLKCKKFKLGLINSSVILSIILNFIDMSSFHNDYYWLNFIDNIYIFNTIIVIEWIYGRLMLFLFVYSFIFIIDAHVKKLNKVVIDIENNEFNFEENTCLSNIIKEITNIRHEIEITISFFNNIISITTILGGISIAIFIRDIFPNNSFNLSDINFEPHDRYLIRPFILFLVSQITLLINMTRYSYKRDNVLKYIKSINFINRFLCRMSSEKVMKKTNGNINLVSLNIIEESATTIDWLILGNILSEKWLDFTIFGLSTSDGQLIKKSITLGSTLLFILSFTRE